MRKERQLWREKMVSKKNTNLDLLKGTRIIKDILFSESQKDLLDFVAIKIIISVELSRLKGE